MKKRHLFLSMLVGAIIFTGCQPPSASQPNEERLKIVTTFPPLYSFAMNVAGDLADVTNLVPAGVSIHNWEPLPSSLKALSQADVLIMNGLDLEPFIEDMIESVQNKDLTVVVTSDAVKDSLIEISDIVELDEHEEDGEHEDEDEHGHEGPDPHVWLSPMLAMEQVRAIRDQLAEKDPDHQEIYEKNANRYLEQLNELHRSIQKNLNTLQPKDFIVFHDAYTYYLNEYDLIHSRRASVEPFPGREPTAAYFSELIHLIEEEGIKVIFTEPQFSSAVVENIKEATGIQSFELDPIGSEISAEGYTNNLNKITHTFINAFK